MSPPDLAAELTAPASLLPPPPPRSVTQKPAGKAVLTPSHHQPPPDGPLTASDVSIGQGTAVQSPVPLASEPILLSACHNLLPGDAIQIQGTRMSRGA